jgi:hypothetical protein
MLSIDDFYDSTILQSNNQVKGATTTRLVKQVRMRVKHNPIKRRRRSFGKTMKSPSKGV